MENVKEYQTVVLAGLLHDIGKLLGRGSFKLLDKGQHPKFSRDFVAGFPEIFASVSDVSLLHELVQRHHESPHFPPEFLVQEIEDSHARTLATLVSKADNLSSSERGATSEQWQDYRQTPLSSVLERINKRGDDSLELRYHARSLGPPDSLETIFPDSFVSYERGELNRHVAQFGKDFSRIFRNAPPPGAKAGQFECHISYLLSILYKYTWCIASNTQEAVPDVSLFDHLKTTAAIASCLYLYHKRTETLNEKAVRRKDIARFCLVAGDISGIQEYIFDIAMGGAGGIARRLRARSLYVQLCSEVAAHLVLRKLGLPIVIHTVINSGGRFYLLLPNFTDVTETVNSIQSSLDEWFLTELNGELALNLAMVQFGDWGFTAGEDRRSGFGSVLESVNTTLAKRKRNRFAEALRVSNQWQESSFVIGLSFKGEEVCNSCRKFPRVTDELCSHCRLDRDTGANLPGASYVAFFDSPAGDIPVLGHSVSIWKSTEEISRQDIPYLVLQLNNPDVSDLYGYPAVSRYLAKFVAEPDGCEICEQAGSPIATFECIAGRSTGDKLLGFLKMDVDYLGESFVFGLKRETGSVDTISRISTFSRMLDLFFSGWVERLTSQDSSIYTVFSGGDDLFLVGPWDKVIYLAETIKKDFDRFTGNPNLTLSAGIIIGRHDYPVSSASSAASEALELSKSKGRDRITILGNTLTWEQWRTVKEEWVKLRDVIDQVPSAFLRNLLLFGDMWKRYREGDTLGLRYHPLLAYNVARNVDPRSMPQLSKWTEKILSLHPGTDEHEIIMDNLGLIGTLLIHSKRGGTK